MGIETAQNALKHGRMEQASHQLTNLEQASNEAVLDMRKTISNLRGERDHSAVTRNFHSQLREHIQKLQTRYNVKTAIHIPLTREMPDVPSEHQTLILQIIQECLVNAYEYAKAQKVVVSLAFIKSAFYINISDDGCGFIYDPVHLGETGHHGLSIMKEIAEESGGTFEINSLIGQGTDIHIVLPLAYNSQLAEQMDALHSLRLLLVDDHEVFLGGLKDMLSSNGLNIVGLARDGQQAVTMAKEIRPDLILMDINLPKINGLEAIKQILADVPGTKIIIVTVSDHEQNLVRAIKSGASGYVLKNLSSRRLLSLLSEFYHGSPTANMNTSLQLLKEYSAVTEKPNSLEPGLELTAIERKIIRFSLQGLTYNQIATALQVSEANIKYHMRKIQRTFNLKNRNAVETYFLDKDF